MPTLRDLVATIRQREGVDAAIVLGRDGLVIEGHLDEGLDADALAACLPAVLSAADGFSAAAQRGDAVSTLLEFQYGFALASILSSEVVLLVLVQPQANVGQLLLEIRRNREHIAALV